MKIFEKLSSFQYERPDFHYLSKAEAEAIAAKFENEDGTTGAHWSFDTMRNAVEKLTDKDRAHFVRKYFDIAK